jgi:hypothetical protein
MNSMSRRMLIHLIMSVVISVVMLSLALTFKQLSGSGHGIFGDGSGSDESREHKIPVIVVDWPTSGEVDINGFPLYYAPVDEVTQTESLYIEQSAIHGSAGSGETYGYVDTTPVADSRSTGKR